MVIHKWIVILAFALTACGGQATPATTQTNSALPSPTASNATALPRTAPTAIATNAVRMTPTIVAQSASPTSAPTAVSVVGEYTSAEGDRVWGRPDAPVTLIDYSDFQ